MVKNSAGISVAYQINDCCSLYPINDCIIPQESRISPLEEDPQAAPEVGGDLENLFFRFFLQERWKVRWGWYVEGSENEIGVDNEKEENDIEVAAALMKLTIGNKATA